MNYELAKQLKDAGFPQNKATGTNYAAGALPTDPQYYAPTLEELVEACGNQFMLLENLEPRNQSRWVAHQVFNEPRQKVLACNGATPSEAVAKLWLALHATLEK